MKKKCITLMLLIFSLFMMNGQERSQKIRALKTAFITQELSLTVEEAEKFWPVFNIYDEERMELHEKTKKLLFEAENLSKLSEKEAEELLQKFDKIEDDFMKNRKKSDANLLPIIGAKKVLLLKRAEEKFKRRLLKQFRDGKVGPPPHRP